MLSNCNEIRMIKNGTEQKRNKSKYVEIIENRLRKIHEVKKYNWICKQITQKKLHVVMVNLQEHCMELITN